VPDLWSDLLSCLELAPDPARNHDDTDVAVFEGRNQQLEYHRVFGGQLLGQFIQIASLTCPDKAVKSQHAVFAKEGRADEPIRYEATRHHEGRSFATVTITARQTRGVVATSTRSRTSARPPRESTRRWTCRRSSRQSDEKEVLVNGEYKLPKTIRWLTLACRRCQSCETNVSHLSYVCLVQ
jgi:Acyl-CoA thioesterase N-terminal domain